MIKPLSRMLFYIHFDVLMGRMIPPHFKHVNTEKIQRNDGLKEVNEEREKEKVENTEGNDTT